jgi:hypothetical protein
VPIAKGGDNSIQTYGIESEAAQRRRAAVLVKAYLDSQAEARWARACSYLTVKARTGLEGLAEGDGAPSAGCSSAMVALLGEAPRAALRRAAQIEVLSFRVRGKQGFVVYRDGSGEAFNLPLRREAGEWRVGALVGIGLAL